MPKWGCSVCMKSFKRKGDFTRHTLIHEGNPSHRCDICGKTFYQFSGLRTHWNVHTGAKPFKCGVGLCRKEFGDPSSCSRHRKEIHSGGIMYRCPFNGCSTSIKRRSAFATHIRSKHAGWRFNENLDAFTVPSPQSGFSDLPTQAIGPDFLSNMFGNPENNVSAAPVAPNPTNIEPVYVSSEYSPSPSSSSSSVASRSPNFDFSYASSEYSPMSSPPSSIPSPAPNSVSQITGCDTEYEYLPPASFPSLPYGWASASPHPELSDAMATPGDWSPDMFPPYKTDLFIPRWQLDINKL